MTLFFYILIAVITFVAFLHAYQKKEYEISRTVVINKPKAEVFAYMRQLKKQPIWQPWFQNEPKTILKFKGEDGYEGATLYWKGNSKIGEGIVKITKVRSGKLVDFKLVFLKPFKLTASSYMAIKEVEPDITKMIWGIRGKHNFPFSCLTVFWSTEKAFGQKVETGLFNLKKTIESKP